MQPDKQKALGGQLEEFVVREGGEWYRVAYPGNTDSMFSAFWKLPAGKYIADHLPLTILSYIVKGFGSSTRVGEGRTVRDVMRPGTLSLVTSDAYFRSQADFSAEVLAFYLDPQKLKDFAEQNVDLATVPMLENLFGAKVKNGSRKVWCGRCGSPTSGIGSHRCQEKIVLLEEIQTARDLGPYYRGHGLLHG